MRTARWTAILLAAAAIAAASYYLVGRRKPSATEGPRGGPAAEPVPRVVRALGRLTPAGGVVDLGAPPGEQLAALEVAEGDPVTRGQVLGRLASYETLQLQVALLQRRREAAERSRAAGVAAAQARVAQARVALEQAKAERERQRRLGGRQAALLAERRRLARKRLERLEALGRDDPELVGAWELDQQRVAAEQADYEWRQAVLAAEAAEEAANWAVTAAEAELAAAQAAADQAADTSPLEVLDGEIEAARRRAALSQLRSPIDGEVLQVLAEPGDLAGPQPLLRLADLRRMQCVAEVYETEAKRIAPGQRATITSPAFLAPFDERGLRGVVRRVRRVVAGPGLRSTNPLAAPPQHVVHVTIDIAPEGGSRREAFRRSVEMVDLQVDVAIETGPADGEGSAAGEPEGTGP